MAELQEICEGRLKIIKKLEKSFGTNPTWGEAIILKDLWENWGNEKWGFYMGKNAPNMETIREKIDAYSSYIETRKKNIR